MPFTTLPALTRRGFGLSLTALGVRVAKAAGPEHWALLSDTHIPADAADRYRGFSPLENLRKVIPQVAAANVEGALICGDLARLEGTQGDYAALKSLLAPISSKLPMALALGNHDDRQNFQAAFAVSNGGMLVKGKHVAIVETDSLRMIVLDSLVTPNSTPGLLGKAQRDWLAGELAGGGAKPVLIFVHHTLDDGDGSLLDSPRLFDIAGLRKQVKAIIFGHSHRYSYDTWDGIHLINLPAVGYNFADNQPVGWVEATLTAEGGDFKLRAIGGNMTEDGKTRSLRWRA